jgi:aspartate kinase
VFTADPNVVAKARKIDRISYEEMLEMASIGAKVLQIRSVEFAMKYNVPVHVRSSFSEEEGTMVINEDNGMERVVVSAVTMNKSDARITLRKVPDSPGIAAKIFTPVAAAGISVDMIIQNTRASGKTDLTFTVPKADYKTALAIEQQVAKEIEAEDVFGDENIAKISVTGVGMRSHPGVAARMFACLAREGINIMMISTSEIRISCLIEQKYAELAVQALHTEFGLDAP